MVHFDASYHLSALRMSLLSEYQNTLAYLVLSCPAWVVHFSRVCRFLSGKWHLGATVCILGSALLWGCHGLGNMQTLPPVVIYGTLGSLRLLALSAFQLAHKSASTQMVFCAMGNELSLSSLLLFSARILCVWQSSPSCWACCLAWACLLSSFLTTLFHKLRR